MNEKSPRITGPTLRVLREFLVRPIEQLSGVDISRSTGLASGTLYPILFRLEEAGWLESAWENVSASEVKRPRRRLYRITAVGESCARRSFAEVFPGTPEFAI